MHKIEKILWIEGIVNRSEEESTCEDLIPISGEFQRYQSRHKVDRRDIG